MGQSKPLALLSALTVALSVSTFPAVAGAQIVINELIPNPNGSETGAEELIEIYNAGGSAVDMTGWAIEDAATIDDATIRARITRRNRTSSTRSSATSRTSPTRTSPTFHNSSAKAR